MPIPSTITSYYPVDGEILAEFSTVSSRVDYVPDGLGSTVATAGTTASDLNQYSYSAWGVQESKSGTATDPMFRWAGSSGYRQTARQFSDAYVRARHYSGANGGWTTLDPLWPGMAAYLYVDSAPFSLTDPDGMKPQKHDKNRCKSPFSGNSGASLADVNDGRGSDQLTQATIAAAIASDPCCRALLTKNVLPKKPDSQKKLQQATAYLNRAITCLICDETNFEEGQCFGSTGSFSGLFQMGQPFLNRFTSGVKLSKLISEDNATSIHDQLRIGVHAFCALTCEGNGGCNCTNRLNGKTKAVADGHYTWPTDWPYLPGPKARQHPEDFTICMSNAKLNASKPPWRQ